MARIDLDQNLRGRPGIASDRVRSLHADQTHAKAAPIAANATCRFPVISANRGTGKHFGFPFIGFSSASAIEHGQAAKVHHSCAVTDPSSSCGHISSVKTAVNNINTIA